MSESVKDFAWKYKKPGFSKVTRTIDFIGRKALKEHYKGFIICPKCMGMIHHEESPHLEKQLQEAISFPIYHTVGHVYFLNERVMIDVARYKGIVP